MRYLNRYFISGESKLFKRQTIKIIILSKQRSVSFDYRHYQMMYSIEEERETEPKAE